MLVSSLTPALLERYGKDFLDSFLKFWPSERLTVYWEGDDLPDDYDRIQWRYIDEVEGYPEWMDRISKFPFMLGNVGEAGYNIQYDARHVRKALIEMHGLRQFGGKVFWADADIIFHSPVPEDFVNTILPDDKFCCYCGRENWMYPETGFIGFNANHEIYEGFVRLYREVFFSGVIFSLQGWHDCYGFDLVRRVMKRLDAFVNLSKDLPYGTMHPVINSILGSVMDHMKGPRKGKGSTRKDLVIERNEPYWLNARAS